MLLGGAWRTLTIFWKVVRVIVSLPYPAVQKLLSVPALLLRPDPAKDVELVAAG
jgi:hypothetical protein